METSQGSGWPRLVPSIGAAEVVTVTSILGVKALVNLK
jgi:negative regulator of sigma E activity